MESLNAALNLACCKITKRSSSHIVSTIPKANYVLSIIILLFLLLFLLLLLLFFFL